jgi:histidine phosphotransferase ChpT
MAAMDIRVVELLCSRLCHDLVGPVSAINNGVELMEEMGEEMGDEALGLIAQSAQQTARRLQVLRLAYGAAGAEAASFADSRTAAANYFQGGKITLDWPPGAVDDGLAQRRGMAKVLINAILLGEEALPYGGTVSPRGAGGSVTVAASGRSAGLKPESRDALDGLPALADLGPRTVHAYATGRFAEHYGLKVEASGAGPDRLELVIRG